MNPRPFWFLSLVVAVLSLIVSPPLLNGQNLHYQQVVNNTGAPRDDLHVVVSQVVTGKFKAPPFTRGNLTPGTQGRGMDFDQGVVNPGELAGVRWVNGFKTDMILEGYWTLGGVPKEPIKTNTVIMRPSVLPGGTAILALENTSPMPVTYTGLTVVNGADINSFDVDNFILGMTSGMPVETTAPPDGTLPPGATTVATFLATKTGYMAVVGTFDGLESAEAWTVDRTGSTSIKFSPGSNDRSASAVRGVDGNIFIAGGTQAGPPTGQISAAIAGLSNFGSLDQGFGTGGLVTDNVGVNTNDYFDSIDSLITGFLVEFGASNSPDFATGGFFGSKYDLTGTLDPTFANAGHLFFQFDPSSRDQINGVVQSGNINVLAGQSCVGPLCQDAILIVDNSGNPISVLRDTKAQGILAVAPASVGQFYALLQKDNPMGRQAFTLARYNVSPLGIDTSFANQGIAQFNFDPNSTDSPFNLRVGADGPLYLIGASQLPGSFPSVGVMKLTSTGALDSSFGTGGKARFQIGFSSQAFSAALDSTAKLVVAGFAQPSPTDPANGMVLRLNTNGTLDTTFNETGILLWSSPGNNVVFTGAIAEPLTNNVIATGTQLDSGNNGSFTAVKRDQSGAPDPGFGDLKP